MDQYKKLNRLNHQTLKDRLTSCIIDGCCVEVNEKSSKFCALKLELPHELKTSSADIKINFLRKIVFSGTGGGTCGGAGGGGGGVGIEIEQESLKIDALYSDSTPLLYTPPSLLQKLDAWLTDPKPFLAGKSVSVSFSSENRSEPMFPTSSFGKELRV
ncbi:hypothetical protein BpHYR1_010728 [Brachionus plicatilis]|uniref:Uncharacterized protein n=1 Tax=Brachionus plicatilis TaxID=10195 RepID=A0A3M7SZ89_BRAPC|nr:hypothetical protein BpHYR1_010728 [Brachionus plicatilis]